MKKWITLILVSMLVCAQPAVSFGAAMEWSASLTEHFGKLTGKADAASRSKLTSLRSELLSLQSQEKKWQQDTKSLHSRNAEALAQVRKKEKEIDGKNLRKLTEDLQKTKDRYRPLFELYTSLNKQISAARSVGSKEVAKALQAQANRLKPAIQLARMDVKTKEEALGKAKEQKARLVKQIRDVLAGRDTWNAKAKAHRSAISASKKARELQWKDFTYYVKKGDVTGTVRNMNGLAALCREIADGNKALYESEMMIHGVITKASSMASAK